MNHALSQPSRGGFTVVEFIVAVVFIAVVLGPLLVFAVRIQEMNHLVGQQGRLEAWRSFNDQVVGQGVSPGAPGLWPANNPAVPSAPPVAAEPQPTVAPAGHPRLVPLHVAFTAPVAEERPRGAGLQIGPGTPGRPRTDPLLPLPPITMPAPQVTPASGTVVALSGLEPRPAPEAFALTVRARAISTGVVRLVLARPAVTATGFAQAAAEADALDLMNGVSGEAWTEFAGAAGVDEAVTLADGRVRWLVRTADDRLQIYDPSARISFSYQLGLGAPVLVRGAVEIAPGAQVAIDYPAYLAVQAGAESLRVDFPAAVKAAFGGRWPAAAIGFRLGFNGVAGPFTGELQRFFAEDALDAWTNAVLLTADAVVPSATVVDGARWTLQRRVTALDVPLLATTADRAGFYPPGTLQFRVPPLPGGGPAMGRLAFEGGRVLSTGTTVAVDVVP